MACILLRIWHASSSSYDMHPPPHMACILLLIWHASISSYGMHPPPHMTCTDRTLQSIQADMLNCRPFQYSLPFSGLWFSLGFSYLLNCRPSQYSLPYLSSKSSDPFFTLAVVTTAMCGTSRCLKGNLTHTDARTRRRRQRHGTRTHTRTHTHAKRHDPRIKLGVCKRGAHTKVIAPNQGDCANTSRDKRICPHNKLRQQQSELQICN